MCTCCRPMKVSSTWCTFRCLGGIKRFAPHVGTNTHCTKLLAHGGRICPATKSGRGPQGSKPMRCRRTKPAQTIGAAVDGWQWMGNILGWKREGWRRAWLPRAEGWIVKQRRGRCRCGIAKQRRSRRRCAFVIRCFVHLLNFLVVVISGHEYGADKYKYRMLGLGYDLTIWMSDFFGRTNRQVTSVPLSSLLSLMGYGDR
jgi:hypothetical protein